MREHRPLAGDEVRRCRVEERVADDIGRHQVGGELDTPCLAGKSPCQSLDQQRLAQTRHALDQDMRICEESDQHLLDHGLLTDHRFRHLAAQRAEPLGGLLQLVCRQGGDGTVHGGLLKGHVPVRAGCALHR
ncbi:MAG: hypothetical protein AW07_01317 [Candidatus Accumulibacter sp. SK-11]|nr:MAG: hypothetical protein AW07_01317 [Candidatus Accumulibacter sp. SK-11]